jgi:deoxycytidylate deaminase
MECAKSIINAGIKRVFYLSENYDQMANWLFMHAGVDITPILRTAVKDTT